MSETKSEKECGIDWVNRKVIPGVTSVYDVKRDVIYAPKQPGAVAEIALELCSKLATVGDDAHEDSEGRMVMKLMSPEKVAERACDIAQMLWAEFEARGLLVNMGEPRLTEAARRQHLEATSGQATSNTATECPKFSDYVKAPTYR